jgi:hypothetical protein
LAGVGATACLTLRTSVLILNLDFWLNILIFGTVLRAGVGLRFVCRFGCSEAGGESVGWTDAPEWTTRGWDGAVRCFRIMQVRGKGEDW